MALQRRQERGRGEDLGGESPCSDVEESTGGMELKGMGAQKKMEGWEESGA